MATNGLVWMTGVGWVSLGTKRSEILPDPPFDYSGIPDLEKIGPGDPIDGCLLFAGHYEGILREAVRQGDEVVTERARVKRDYYLRGVQAAGGAIQRLSARL
jgi:hypothetical protein